MNEQEYVYVGTRKCGCRVAAILDMPEPGKREWTAESVAGFIKDGYTLSREPAGTFAFDKCEHP